MEPSDAEDSEATPSAVGSDRKCSKLQNCCGTSPKGAKRCFGHNYHHVARCGMCKPGRYHRAGGAKAFKKISSRNGSRSAWMLILNDARTARLNSTDIVDECALQFRPLPVPTAANKLNVWPSTRKPITLADWFPEDRNA